MELNHSKLTPELEGHMLYRPNGKTVRVTSLVEIVRDINETVGYQGGCTVDEFNTSNPNNLVLATTHARVMKATEDILTKFLPHLLPKINKTPVVYEKNYLSRVPEIGNIKAINANYDIKLLKYTDPEMREQVTYGLSPDLCSVIRTGLNFSTIFELTETYASEHM